MGSYPTETLWQNVHLYELHKHLFYTHLPKWQNWTSSLCSQYMLQNFFSLLYSLSHISPLLLPFLNLSWRKTSRSSRIYKNPRSLLDQAGGPFLAGFLHKVNRFLYSKKQILVLKSLKATGLWSWMLHLDIHFINILFHFPFVSSFLISFCGIELCALTACCSQFCAILFDGLGLQS